MYLFNLLHQRRIQSTVKAVYILSIKSESNNKYITKKRLQHRCFSMNIPNFLRTDYFIEHLWWLPLFPVTRCFLESAFKNLFKGTLSGLRQFLATESRLNVMRKCFLFHLKSSFCSRNF